MNSYTVRDVLNSRPFRKVVFLQAKASPVDNFQVLIDEGIQSAPVVAASGNGYDGFLDIRDLAACILSANQGAALRRQSIMADDEADGAEGADTEKEVTMNRLAKLFIKDKHLPYFQLNIQNPEPVISTSYLAKIHPIVYVEMQNSLTTLIAKLSDPATRRVAVHWEENEDSANAGTITAIISRMDVVRFLNKSGLCEEKTVEEVGVGSSPVISLDPSATAMEGFALMKKKGIGAVAVMQEGRLMATLTNSDIKLWLQKPQQEADNLLATPVLQFLTEIRRKTYKTIHPFIHVEMSSSIGDVFSKLAVTGVHHVFVMAAGETRPTRVISLLDCLASMLQQPVPQPV